MVFSLQFLCSPPCLIVSNKASKEILVNVFSLQHLQSCLLPLQLSPLEMLKPHLVCAIMSLEPSRAMPFVKANLLLTRSHQNIENKYVHGWKQISKCGPQPEVAQSSTIQPVATLIFNIEMRPHQSIQGSASNALFRWEHYSLESVITLGCTSVLMMMGSCNMFLLM